MTGEQVPQERKSMAEYQHTRVKSSVRMLLGEQRERAWGSGVVFVVVGFILGWVGWGTEIICVVCKI